jgi:hypothetical protein
VSPDVSTRQRARLEAGGWELVEFRSGKSLWRRLEGGRLYTLKSALKHVNRQEGGELEAAGWEAVEGERMTFWRRPDTGHLYAQEAAIAVVRRADRGGAA